MITTVARSGKLGLSRDRGPATKAKLDSPYGRVIDSAGSLHIAHHGNGRIRKVDSHV